MAMLISKFNKLISSRLLWGAILVLIIFAFVVWGMQWPAASSAAASANAPGELDGKPVPQEEYAAAYNAVYLAYVLSNGRESLGTPDAEQALRRGTWNRLALLREARKLGLSATDEDVYGAIRGNFSDRDGHFQLDAYQSFVSETLAGLGYSESQFRAFIEQEILARKLAALVGAQAVVVQPEIDRMGHLLFDSCTAAFATVAEKDLAEAPAPSDEDVRAAYDADPARWTLPEKRAVSVVSFPLADYADAAPATDDDALQDYYDQHIAKFARAVTNGEGEVSTEIADLADVKDEIVSALAETAQEEAAEGAARDFAYNALPGDDNVIPDFAAVAEAAGKSVRALDAFDRLADPLPEAGAAFVPAVFALEQGPFERISAPVRGEDAYFVACLASIEEPRVPEFDECADRVREAVVAERTADALKARADEAAAAVAAAVKEGKSFAEAVAAAGLDADGVRTLDAFTGLEANQQPDPVRRAVSQAVLPYPAGAVAKPVRIPGGYAVAFVGSRTPVDAEELAAYAPQIAQSIRQSRAMTLVQNFQEGLLGKAGWKDYRAAADKAAEDEAAEEAPAAEGESEI
ncbi:MAG: peptidyl-prolyl cis-trans isomerase [Kiritimatiellae bacterium]|nr:peptidyl-prolyl cis-trans isomerase [Kiritimatiellia bacterium]